MFRRTLSLNYFVSAGGFSCKRGIVSQLNNGVIGVTVYVTLLMILHQDIPAI